MEDGHYGSFKSKGCVPEVPARQSGILYPRYTNISFKSLKKAVDFHPAEKLPCKNTWYRDLKSTHIRNKRLLDLPYTKPKCCSDIYNATLDRQKLKKLQKYGLTRPVRTIVRTCKPEKVKKCELKEEKDEKKIVYFPECYEPSDMSSDDEDDSYELCRSGSVSECSGCSTLGGGKRTKMHKVVKKDLEIYSKEVFCSEKVAEELKKHQLGRNFQLKLKKVF